jgi:hypothetical protein
MQRTEAVDVLLCVSNLLILQVIESLMELLVSVRHWNPRVLGMDDDGEAKKVCCACSA